MNAFLAEHAPPVLDPFCGGGSIPLEAQRLGLRAYASDLNPVPVLINKALIEIPPKFAGRPPVNPKSAKGQRSEVTELSKGMAGRDGPGRGRAVLRPMDARRGREADRPPVSRRSKSPPRWRRPPRPAPLRRTETHRHRLALGRTVASPNPAAKVLTSRWCVHFGFRRRRKRDIRSAIVDRR